MVTGMRESTLDALERIWVKGTGVKAKEKPRREMIGRMARILCKLDNLAVIDTETTGLTGSDEVCEVAVVSWDGVLFHSLIKPTMPIPEDATRIHGIKDADVLDAPTMAQAWPTLERVMRGRFIVAYNGSFDFRILRQSLEQAGVAKTFGCRSRPWHERPAGVMCVDTADVMRMYAAWNGERMHNGGFTSKKLVHAVEHFGLEFEGEAHGALADAKATLAVLGCLAGDKGGLA